MSARAERVWWGLAAARRSVESRWEVLRGSGERRVVAVGCCSWGVSQIQAAGSARMRASTRMKSCCHGQRDGR
jgi:hypothetical protein